jgi:hypothetical protein
VNAQPVFAMFRGHPVCRGHPRATATCQIPPPRSGDQTIEAGVKRFQAEQNRSLGAPPARGVSGNSPSASSASRV